MNNSRLPMLIPTAEPFFFPGNETGCLLVHGFTGTPKEMRWMGEYLAVKGYSVLGVRLAAHATQPDDMLRVRWQDWAASVEDGWHILRGTAERIFVIGLSLGGVLALIHAARFSVAGVVAISTPYEMPPDPRQRFIKLLRYLVPSISKGEPDWRNPQAALDHVAYPEYPTAAIIQVQEILSTLRDILPQVTAPSLLVHSRDDLSVRPKNMPKIYAAIQSSEKTMLWVENSGHVIIREPERERVFAATHDFIQRIVRKRA